MAARSKEKSVNALDGLVLDLFKRVENAVDYQAMTPEQHLDSVKAIHRTLGQIQKHERPRVNKHAQSTPLEASAKMEGLKEWLHQHGVKTDGLQLTTGLLEGCGVTASQAFKEGQTVCRVPLSAMMTLQTAIQATDDVGLLYGMDPWLRAVPSLVLAIHLLFEKHRPSTNPSPWLPYIRSLPAQSLAYAGETNPTDTPDGVLPLAFSVDTVAQLQGTSALPECHRLLRTVAKQYCHMRTLFRQLAHLSPAIHTADSQWFSYVEFRWAVSMVMTRQNQFPLPASLLQSAAETGKAALQKAVQVSTAAMVAKAKEKSNIGSSAEGSPAAAVKDDSQAASVSTQATSVAGSASSTATSTAAAASASAAAGSAGTAGKDQDGDSNALVTVMALVPLMDLFNHEEGPISSHYDASSAHLEVAAKRPFSQGDQIYMSYGYRPNSMLLLYAGFLPSVNSRDRYRVAVSLPASDSLANKKAALLKWMGFPPTGPTHVDLFGNGEPSPQLLAWLNVAGMEDEAAVTAELRTVIGAKAQETARKLEQQKVDGGGKGEEEPSAEAGEPSAQLPPSSPPIPPSESLSKSQAALLAEACEKRLKELQKWDRLSATSAAPAAASSEPAGLGGVGLLGKKSSGSASALVCQVERELVARLRAAERKALEKAVAKCKLGDWVIV